MDDGGEVPATRVGIGEFFLATESIVRGLVFFVDDGERFEIRDEPVNIGGGRYFATVRQLAGRYAGREITAQLHVGRRVR